jgi:hypothetical protein
MASPLFKKTILISLISFSVFFVWSKHDIFAQPAPVTEAVAVSAQVGEDIVITPGGSHGGVSIPRTAVIFSGLAYPGALVSLLKQGETRATVKADSSGNFTITLEESYNSTVLYSLFAEDRGGERSLLLNYPIAVQAGFITHLSGIRFAPTILSDKSQVRYGDYLTVHGYSLPQKEMEISILGREKRVFTLTSSEDGSYRIILPLSTLSKGDYYITIGYADDLRTSKLVKFVIGESNIFYTETLSSIPGDCNADKVINLIDFSILAFWYGKSNPPVCVDTNADKVINLIDFSILAFYWTG